MKKIIIMLILSGVLISGCAKEKETNTNEVSFETEEKSDKEAQKDVEEIFGSDKEDKKDKENNFLENDKEEDDSKKEDSPLPSKENLEVNMTIKPRIVDEREEKDYILTDDDVKKIEELMENYNKIIFNKDYEDLDSITRYGKIEDYYTNGTTQEGRDIALQKKIKSKYHDDVVADIYVISNNQAVVLNIIDVNCDSIELDKDDYFFFTQKMVDRQDDGSFIVTDSAIKDIYRQSKIEAYRDLSGEIMIFWKDTDN